MTKSEPGRLAIVTNVLCIVVVLAFAVHPRGPLVGTVLERWATRQQKQALEASWPQLSQRASALGTRGGAQVLVEFSDYQCPWCRRGHEEVEKLLEARPESRVVYLHVPLRTAHPAAWDAARTAICAEIQGRFGEMHRALMTSDEWITSRDWRELAGTAQVPNMDAFDDCMASTLPDERIEQDLGMARDLGVSGTPTFLSPREIRSGLQSSIELVSMLDGQS